MNDLGVPFVKFSLGIWDQGIKSEEAYAVFSYREKDFLEGWLTSLPWRMACLLLFPKRKNCWGLTLKHRITGSVRLGKNSKVIEPSLTDPHCVNQTTALSATSGCSLDPSRDGDSTTFLPMFINPSKEEIPPGVQPELPPVQLRTISSCHVRMAQSQGYGHIDKGLGQSWSLFWQGRGSSCSELPQRTSEIISHSLFVPTLSLTLDTHRHLEESLQRVLSSLLAILVKIQTLLWK